MSDENKVVIENEHKCFCQSKGFRKFLVIALGTFVGVYSALCLFAALHKPPIFRGDMGFAPCPCQTMMIHKHYLKKHDGHFDRKFKDMERKAPFEAQKDTDND